MSEKIAIDIVLLLPEEITNKVIEINNQLPGDLIKLNKKDSLPHISLCMGVVKKEDLPKIKKIIHKIGENFSELFLTIDRIDNKRVCFEIKNNKNLQKLHEDIMTKLSPYLSYDATTDMCSSPPLVVERTLFWINNYKDQFCLQNFRPHITLGISKLKSQKLSIDFVASKLAISHIGNYCTCRKIFYSRNLATL